MPLNDNAVRYVPTSAKTGTIVSLCIAGECGDVERLGLGGVIDALYNPNKSFVGVVTRAPHDIQNGGRYGLYSPADMIDIRLAEQQKAANIGSYGSIYVLNYQSYEDRESIIEDYVSLFKAYRPEIVYTYSPFEKDPAKIEVMKMVITALGRIEDGYRPQVIYGSYLGASLDLLADGQSVSLGLDSKVEYAYSVLDIYDSANENGENWDVALDAFDLSGIDTVEKLQKVVTECLDTTRQAILDRLMDR